MAPAAKMTSRLAKAVYLVEPPLAGPNSTPEALKGTELFDQLILVTYSKGASATSKRPSEVKLTKCLVKVTQFVR